MAHITSLPHEILHIIFGFFFINMQYHRHSMFGAWLDAADLPDGMQLLLTCQRMLYFGRKEFAKRARLEIWNKNNDRAWCDSVLQKCPWGASLFYVHDFHNGFIIRKICHRLSLLEIVQWSTSKTFELKSRQPLPANLPNSDLLRLLNQNDKFKSNMSHWRWATDRVPNTKITFQVTRQVRCEQYPRVSHRLRGEFILKLKFKNGETLHAMGTEKIWDHGEGCSCSRKYLSAW